MTVSVVIVQIFHERENKLRPFTKNTQNSNQFNKDLEKKDAKDCQRPSKSDDHRSQGASQLALMVKNLSANSENTRHRFDPSVRKIP